jgi:hypothetical protein
VDRPLGPGVNAWDGHDFSYEDLERRIADFYHHFGPGAETAQRWIQYFDLRGELCGEPRRWNGSHRGKPSGGAFYTFFMLIPPSRTDRT